MSTYLDRRHLGADFQVASIGLGCMGMSEFYGPTDRTQSLATLHKAADLGVTLFDTADMYGSGENEQLLSSFLSERRADGIQIATKFGIVRDSFDYAPADHLGISNDPDYARRACEASLRRLKTDFIDLFYVHRIEPGRPIEEVMETLSQLVQEGKIGHIGLSEVSPETLQRAHSVHPIAAVQSEYSLWSRAPEDGILETCETLGVGFVAYSPLGRGFLTGALKVDQLASDDWRKTNPRFSDEAVENNRKLVDTVKAIAFERSCSPAQLLLAWVLAKRPFIVPIPGTKRTSYLEDNLGAASVSLTPNDLAKIESVIPAESVFGAPYSEAGMSVLNG